MGHDLLSRLIHGARLSLTVGLAATTLTVVVAVLIGGTTGFIGGRLDLVTQRFVDAWMAFPGLLLLLTIMSIAGRGMAQIIIVLGVSGGIPASRVVRGAVLGVKENVYFQAAQAIGSSRRRSLLRHVLPNIAAPIIIIFSINVGGVIMSEQYMEIAPHLALWPGVCLTVVVYSLNMFGDAVRDLLDPRLRGRLGRYGAGRGGTLRRLRKAQIRTTRHGLCCESSRSSAAGRFDPTPLRATAVSGESSARRGCARGCATGSAHLRDPEGGSRGAWR